MGSSGSTTQRDVEVLWILRVTGTSASSNRHHQNRNDKSQGSSNQRPFQEPKLEVPSTYHYVYIYIYICIYIYNMYLYIYVYIYIWYSNQYLHFRILLIPDQITTTKKLLRWWTLWSCSILQAMPERTRPRALRRRVGSFAPMTPMTWHRLREVPGLVNVYIANWKEPPSVVGKSTIKLWAIFL